MLMMWAFNRLFSHAWLDLRWRTTFTAQTAVIVLIPWTVDTISQSAVRLQ